MEPPRDLWASLRHIGPGIIISGSIVGSGELIVTTRLGAEVGFVLLWLVLFSCFIKVFLQIELGRHAIASGSTALAAFDALPGPRLRLGRIGANWMVCLWAVMGFCSVIQLGGILLGLARVLDLDALGIGSGTLQVALLLIVGATAIVLATGRYAHVERTATVLVFVFTAVTVLAVLAVQASSELAIGAADVGSGLVPGLPDGGLVTAFAVLGITGVGASELVYYPYWCLEKGYARHVGPPDGSAAWLQRARGWIGVMKVDAWVSFGVYTVATVAFYLLGAATLHRRGIVPDNENMHEALSEMYTSSFGEASGIWLYVAGASAVLFSTFFVATASNSRVFADAFAVFRIVRFKDARHRMQLVRFLCVLLPFFCWGTVMLFDEEPVSLVLVGGIAQAALLPFLAFAALFLRYRRTARELVSRSYEDVFLWLALVSMLAIGIHQLWDRLLR